MLVFLYISTQGGEAATKSRGDGRKFTAKNMGYGIRVQGCPDHSEIL